MRYLVPVGGALLGGAVGVAAYTAHVLNGPRRPDPLAGYSFTPWEVQVPFEDVSFTADDGVVLRGWWFPQPDSKRVVVGFTGHKGLKQDLLGIGSALWRAGNNVLLFDFRGCGDSDVAPLSLAHNELPDARAAVRYASARIPDAAIGLIGYSMGAAVAILVGGDDPHIRAIVADSSFASIRDVLTHAHGRYRLPAGITVALTDFINRWRYGYHFEAIRPVDAIAGIAPRPILIIHGGTDPLITVDQGYRLYNAARQPKDLWVVEGVGHCGAYFADREVYVDRVAGFFEHCLSRPLLAAVESDVAIHGARHT
ncbi:MAG TPA: alpha/beta fold hydrolase [Chloroflexota bacterium]